MTLIWSWPNRFVVVNVCGGEYILIGSSFGEVSKIRREKQLETNKNESIEEEQKKNTIFVYIFDWMKCIKATKNVEKNKIIMLNQYTHHM